MLFFFWPLYCLSFDLWLLITPLASSNFLLLYCLSFDVWLLITPLALLCDKAFQGLATDLWFSLDTPVSSSNKIDCNDLTEILLQVAFNTITSTPNPIANLFKTLLP
jgi:hypothetical protein